MSGRACKTIICSFKINQYKATNLVTRLITERRIRSAAATSLIATSVEVQENSDRLNSLLDSKRVWSHAECNEARAILNQTAQAA